MPSTVGTRVRLRARPGFGRALSGTLRERLVQPLLLHSGDEERRAIEALPGQYLLSLTEAVREARACARQGIAGVLLFAAPDRHDEDALLATERDFLVPRAIRAIKDAVPELGVATDVCVCAYTRHSQCVLFREGGADVGGTHDRLAEMAAVHAEAGADLVVLSGMLEGSVAGVRSALEGGGHSEVAVASVVKFASALYAPYRAAVGMRAVEQAAVPLLEPGDAAGVGARAARDAAAGADAVIVKPGLLALDVIAALAHAGGATVGGFHVSGELALLRAAAIEGLVDEEALLRESALATRRAGAELILSYAALATADILDDSA